MNNKEKQTVYEITVKGYLKDKWAEWLNGKIISIRKYSGNANDTIITLRVPDQAALRGILNKLWDLNLTLLSLNRR